MNLSDVLELEFQLAYNLNIPFGFNQMEYYEFVWFFERLVEERKKENAESESQNGRMSISNLGVNMADLKESINNNGGITDAREK